MQYPVGGQKWGEGSRGVIRIKRGGVGVGGTVLEAPRRDEGKEKIAVSGGGRQ